MSSGVHRNLVVRIAEVGCLLDLAWVVEIKEEIADLLDYRHADLSQGIIAALNFRQTRVPAVDPSLFLGLCSAVEVENKKALILKSSEGNWALLVDQVVEISTTDRFVPCPIPPLLKVAAQGCYSKLELFCGEPMVVLEPDRIYGSPVAVA